MVGTAWEVTPDWLDTTELIDFIDELRQAGYNIGMSQYVAAHDLVLALMTREEGFRQPQRLKGLLGPILCSSPSEQDDFQERFDRWAESTDYGSLATMPEPRDETALERELDEIEGQSRRWLWVLAAIGVSVVVGPIIYLLWNNSASAGGYVVRVPAQPFNISGFVVWLVNRLLFLLFVLFVLWRLWWFTQARLFLVRRAIDRQPELERISVGGFDERLYSVVPVFRLAQNLRQRVEVPSNKLDIQGTVDSTVRNAGWFTPVYDSLQVPPEYLILVDRMDYQDHQARYFEVLVDRLRENEVFVKTLYFDKDPRICFPTSGTKPPLTLLEVAANYSQHRLIVVSDAERLFDSRTGEIEAWVDTLARWTERAVVTPEPVEQWGYREQELSREFTVAPATVDGLATLVEGISFTDTLHEPVDGLKEPFPEKLRARPRLWIDRHSPQVALIDDVLTSVRRYLGESGFYWFSACAVYPSLQWDLTLYLGNALHTEDGRRLIDASELSEMVRLPWFRYGYMPDWLRIRLISELDKQQEESIRSALAALLMTAVKGPINGFQLEVAKERSKSLSRLAKPLIRLLSRRASPDSPLRDYVFLDTMAGRPPSRLAVQLPEILGDLSSRSLSPRRKLSRLAVQLPEILDDLSRQLLAPGRRAGLLGYLVAVAVLGLISALMYRDEALGLLFETLRDPFLVFSLSQAFIWFAPVFGYLVTRRPLAAFLIFSLGRWIGITQISLDFGSPWFQEMLIPTLIVAATLEAVFLLSRYRTRGVLVGVVAAVAGAVASLVVPFALGMGFFDQGSEAIARVLLAALVGGSIAALLARLLGRD